MPDKSRTLPQYVVVRENGNSGAFIVTDDGTMTQEYYADSIFHGPAWHKVSDTCQCGDKAVTAGHFTNKREAEKAARQANRNWHLGAGRPNTTGQQKKTGGKMPTYTSK